MTIEKTRSLPWFALSVAGALMTMLVMLTVSMVSGWATTVNGQLREAERRLGNLERQYAVIEQQMQQNSLDHEEIITLLREHVRR
jgi:hypothetical protein